MRTILNITTAILLSATLTQAEAETITADGFIYEIVDIGYLRLVGLTDDFSIEDVVIPDSVDLGSSRGFFPVKTVTDSVSFRDKNIKTLTYGANVDSIGRLYGAYSLEEIDLSKSLVQEIPDFFSGGGENLSTIKFPKVLKRINPGAFTYSNLNSVELPDSLEFIGEHTFSMSPINHLKMNNQLKWIDNYAFARCPLHDVEWSDSITIIGWGAFYETELYEVIIPNNASMGAYSFSGIKTLKTVKSYIASPENYGDDASSLFEDSDLSSCTLWVPKGSMELYKSNPAWAGFAEIKEMGQTGIDNVFNQTLAISEIYDMFGRKVTHPTPGNAYIVNGKKLLMK